MIHSCLTATMTLKTEDDKDYNDDEDDDDDEEGNEDDDEISRSYDRAQRRSRRRR